MFPGPAGINSSFTPQPLSPIRNLQGMGNSRNFTGQRPFPERRPMPSLGSSNPMGTMGSFGMPPNRQYGSQGTMNSFHSVFGVSGDNNTPPLLDLNEFPSLTNRGQGDSMPQPSPMPGKQPYVGMVKQPTSEASEFTMSSEDFPALPGTQNNSAPVPSSDKGLVGLSNSDSSHDVSSRAPGAEKSGGTKRGIQTSPDGMHFGCWNRKLKYWRLVMRILCPVIHPGKVTHIPNSMVKDQFGMIGLLQFIRAAESDANLMSLALGQDLTALGLNLNQPDNLYPNFGGPWAEHLCRPQDIDYHVPPEYLINAEIRDRLAAVKFSRYKDDLLFYLFYTYVGDLMQLIAAAELYERDWRYHTDEKVWLTLVPGMDNTYYFFDPQNWRKVAKEFHLDCTKLEARPNLPTLGGQQPVQ